MENNPVRKNTWLMLDAFWGICAAASVLVFIFLMAHASLYDLDIWLHLKTGELIVRTHAIPTRDIFSFTMAGKPWVNHSWLFQIFVYALHAWRGVEGLIFLQSAVITCTFLILLVAGVRLVKSYLEPTAFVLLAALASLSRFNIRPEIFSLLFFAGYLYILSAYAESKKIWLLAFIQILWVNFHGYFVLGPLLVALFLAAEFLKRHPRFLPWQWRGDAPLSHSAYKRLLALFPLLLAAGALTPNGIHGFLYPFAIFKGVLAGNTYLFLRFIQELQPTFTTLAYLNSAYYYVLMVGICAVLFVANIRKVRVFDILLLGWFFLFSQTVRHVAFFAFVAYMCILRYLVPTITHIAGHIKLKASSKTAPYFLIRYALALLIITVMTIRSSAVLGQRYYDFTAHQFKSDLSGINAQSYPERAVDFLLTRGLKGNVFNDFDSGAYLVGRTYPRNRVFIDGRTELYGQAFFKKYLDILNGNTLLFDRMAQAYHINVVLVSLNNRPLPSILAYLYNSPHWKLVFFDAFGVVFVRDTPLYKSLISEYAVDLKHYHVSKADSSGLVLSGIYPAASLNRAHLFLLFKENALAIQECVDALMIMPDCAEAYFLLGKICIRTGSHEKAMRYFREALRLIPRHPSALAGMGLCLREAGDADAANEIFRKLRTRYPPQTEQAIDPEIKGKIDELW